MNLKSIDIGGLKTPNNIFLAPLAGYTNAVFRQICFNLGAGLTFTEMVSAKGLCYNSENTRELLQLTPEYAGIKAVQIFGSEEEYMYRAACSEDIAPFDLIDINMGCPVPKIFKNGEGSALLGDFKKAEGIIKAVKKSGKRVSVKFRTGIDENNIVCVDFAKMCEQAGADMITIHGRVKTRIYSGEVDFDSIAKAKKAVSIPVIANGGIFSKEDAQKLLESTGADGVMLARSALVNPWLFAEITGDTNYNKKAMIIEQIERTRDMFGERFATVFMRKMVVFYIKGMPYINALKEKLFKCATTQEVIEIVKTLNI